MSNFKGVYNQTVDSLKELGKPSPELETLLKRYFEEMHQRPVDLGKLKEAMVGFLTFLTTSKGRTDVNCRAVDFFVNFDNNWERDWSFLPESFQLVIEDIGGALHDTFGDPEIAARLDSTPEQLLSSVKELKVRFAKKS